MTTKPCALILVAIVGLAVSGCGKLKPHDSLDAAATEASSHDAVVDLKPDVAAESRPDVAAESPPDVATDVVAESPSDARDAAPDFDGGVACGPLICGAGEVCLESFPGVDAGPSFECDAASACDGGVPTCACVADFTHSPSVFAGRCEMHCSQSDDRHLQCDGA
jgi:hypothetical protein